MACFNNKKHQLIEVYEHGRYDDTLIVVRWCKICGGVVVDTDIDNRTLPGSVRKMMFPKVALDKVSG